MLSKSKIFWCAATLMGGAVVFSSAALAETYRMRMHVNQPASEKSYHYIYATQFSERVAKYTDNAVKVTIFPGAQLGGDPAVFQQLQLGAVQSGIFAFPNLVEFYKPFNVFSLPFLFGDFDSAVTAFQGPTAQRLYDGFEKQVGVKVLGVFNEGFRGITNNVRAVNKVEDFAGLKIRVPGSPILISTLESLGMSPISLSGGEIFTALQQGTVDGQESTVAWGYGQGYGEVQKYVTETRHAVSGAGLYISAKFFNGLPADIQAAVVRAANESAEHVNAVTKQYDRDVIERYKELGLQVTQLDAADVRPKVEHIWKEYADMVGGMEVIQSLVADGEKTGAPTATVAVSK